LAPRGFRTSDWMRILSMLLMLAVLYMLVVWAQDPKTWRWFADDPGAEKGGQAMAEAGPDPNAGADHPPAEQPAAEPAAKGPTDEDPEEQAAIRDEFQAITDKTLQILDEEMFAYKRIVQWVVNQPASLMRKRAHTDLSFNDFMLAPDKHRGALVELLLDAKLVRTSEFRASDGTDLFEVWGITPESGSWLYATMVVGLPQGMPVATRINERCRFVGYFFKLQGYHEANAKPHAPPLAAPMLIGRLIWIKAPAPAPAKWDASWTAIAAVGFALVVGLHMLWIFLRPRRRKSGMRPIRGPKPGAITMEEWFEKAEEGSAPIGDDAQADPNAPTGGNDKLAKTDGPFSHPLDGDIAGGG
jgi:hypothetical protein